LGLPIEPRLVVVQTGLVHVPHQKESMKSALGVLAGLVLLVLAIGAFRTASGGWSGGHTDIGFWWTVIASFLTIAALGAIIGTVVHSRPAE
jgi:hypothetical protein